jgi:uncharacterized Zn-binding protein involved in type VI secretion
LDDLLASTIDFEGIMEKKPPSFCNGLIRVGDKTSHGGVVITGDPTWQVNDKQVARVGDKATCPKCKRVVTIISSRHPTLTTNGAPIAYDGDMTDCGATLISSTNDRCGWVCEEGQSDSPTGDEVVSLVATENSAKFGAMRRSPSDAETKTGLVTIFVNNNGIGHVSLFIGYDSDRDRILFDPCGSYIKDGNSWRSNIFTAEEFDKMGYWRYHSSDGDDITFYPFTISESEEKTIRNRISDNEGADPGPGCFMACATAVSEAIKGIGPFKNFEPASTPWGMKKEMEKLKRSK